MKLTVQQLRSLIRETVLEEMIDPKATQFVQELTTTKMIDAVIDDTIKSIGSSADALLKARLVTYEEEIKDGAFGRLSTLLEKFISDGNPATATQQFVEENAEDAVYGALNAAIGSDDEE